MGRPALGWDRLQAPVLQTVRQRHLGEGALSSAKVVSSEPARGGHDRFRPDIQGLRGIAVVSVVLYHAFQHRLLPGGFVGVDVFFVISGFLITQVLLREADRGALSIVGFYQRRIRRLFPALMPMVLAVLVAGAFFLSDHDYRELALTAAATATFTVNIAFYRGYFVGAGAERPLLHMWSLSVEEQFYLLFPLFLQVVSRRARPALPALLAGCGLISLGLSAAFSGSNPVPAFYLAPTRAFELIIGCLTAVIADRSAGIPHSLRQVLSLAGLALVMGSTVWLSSAMAFPGLVALAPCLGAALVIFCGVAGKPIGSRLISAAPLRFFGDISYSLYLWHWPLLCFGRLWALGELSLAATAVLLVVSVVLAGASWAWIEQPFLRGMVPWPPLRAGIAAVVVATGVSGAIWAMQGLPQRFKPQSLILFAQRDSFTASGRRCLNAGGPPIRLDRICVVGAPYGFPDVAVWADSEGTELSAALGERLAARGHSLMQITAPGCPPVLGYRDDLHADCARHNREALQGLIADRRIGHVILAANFSGYRGVIPDAQMESGFAAAVRGLRFAGKRVTLVEPTPVLPFDPPKALGFIVNRGGDPMTWGVARASHDAHNARFRAMIAQLAGTTGAEPLATTDLFCDARLCPAYALGEGVLYFDANHTSMAGARRVAAAVRLP
jgi:peptidoglycan/LPS O-acetylase OafA/YrhL